MKQAYLISTHHPPERIHYIVDKLQHEDNCFFIHFDKKLAIAPGDAYYHKLLQMPNVTVLQDRINVQWGGFTGVLATLMLLRVAVQSDAEYMHIISGQCLPVKSVAYINGYMERHRGKEYICSSDMPLKREYGWGYNRVDIYHLHDYYNPRSSKLVDVAIKHLNSFLRKVQRTLVPLGIKRKYVPTYPHLKRGSAWWSLSADCCRYILDYIDKNPAFYNRFKYTQLSDEMFFQTLIHDSPFRDKVANNNLRFLWFNPNANTHAASVGMDQLDELMKEDILFARKFEPGSEIVAYLEAHVFSQNTAS